MAGQSVSESPAITCKRQLLLLLLLCVFLSLMECMHALKSAQPKNGLRGDLVHIDSLLSENTTSTERMKRAIQRSQERLEKISSQVNIHQMKDSQTPVSLGSGDYLIQMAIGTPALSLSAIMDTGSDLVWTKCNPCTDCSTSSIYDPSSSSTYSKVLCQSSLCQSSSIFSCNNDGDCEYVYSYGYNSSSSSTSGILSYETFSFSSQPVPHIAFGCSHSNQGFDEVSGVVGFGRGNHSLVSQLGPSMAYCFVSRTDSSSETSRLMIGSTASLNATTVGSTPILQSTLNPSFYYLSLEGISVDGQSLAIPTGTFDLQSDGSGGLIIDSGTTLTYLQQTAYDAVKEAMVSSINLPQADGVGLDLCFNQQGSSNASFPSMTFHFKGADYDVPKENYLFPDSTSDIVCLAMLPSNSDFAIFGNVQQQNYQILYDNEKNVLSFAPTACDTL